MITLLLSTTGVNQASPLLMASCPSSTNVKDNTMFLRRVSKACLFPGVNSSNPKTKRHGRSAVMGVLARAFWNRDCRPGELATKSASQVLGCSRSQSNTPPAVRGICSTMRCLSNNSVFAACNDLRDTVVASTPAASILASSFRKPFMLTVPVCSTFLMASRSGL